MSLNNCHISQPNQHDDSVVIKCVCVSVGYDILPALWHGAEKYRCMQSIVIGPERVNTFERDGPPWNFYIPTYGWVCQECKALTIHSLGLLPEWYLHGSTYPQHAEQLANTL